jgi:dihydrofolate reductase
MASIRLYVAISIDGFIADAQGSVEWLEAYPPVPVAFSRFIDGVGTIVSGRTTYDNGRDRGWPAAPQTIVVTSRPLADAPNVTAYDGPLDALIARLLDAVDERDVWVIGGGRLMAAFLDADAVDRIILFVVPHVLGSGTPLFSGLRRPRPLRFVSAGPHGDDGIIRLIYEPLPPVIPSAGSRSEP